MAYWGYHLMLDCAGADHARITSGENIAAFAKTLVERIDMVAYGEPQVVRFGSDDKAGYTLVQLIETSNICAHFCNDACHSLRLIGRLRMVMPVGVMRRASIPAVDPFLWWLVGTVVR